MEFIVIIDGKPGEYGVVIPDAPGCTAAGETIEDALTAATDALRVWLELAQSHGAPIPKARTEESVRQDQDVIADLAAGAIIGKVELVVR